MRLSQLAAVSLIGLAACAELSSPRVRTVSLTIVPVFAAADPYAAAATTADSLRIIVLRDSAGVFQDTAATATAAIDSVGEVNTTINVLLLQSPSRFRIVLQAIRSSDGLIVFAGEDTVVVTAQSSSGEGQQVEIPIVYTGPKAKSIVLAPKDTSVTSLVSFLFRVTPYDSLGGIVDPPPVINFFLVNPADSTKLQVGKFTGLATAVTTATDSVRVYAETADGQAADTTRVYLGSVPAALRVTPGYANLGIGDTLTFTGRVVDAGGNPAPSASVTWVSRDTSVASINASGKVTGIAVGTAVLVASGSGFSDSALVTVVTATHAVVSTTSSGSAFRAARVGDTVVVDLTADLRFTPSERLGSYQAAMDWNALVLQYLDVQTTSFAAPTVNPGTANCTHQLCLAAADAQNAAVSVIVARVRFRALAAGTTSPVLSISEMSSNVPPTFTNLFAANRVTVTNGSVTVRP